MEPVASAFAKLVYVILLIPALRASGEALTVKRCTSFNENTIIDNARMNCFCYVPKEEIHLKDIWSSLQVNINSTETFTVVHIFNEVNCQYPENVSVFVKCALQNIWQWGEFKETVISIVQYGDEACFQVQPTEPSSSYTIRAKRNKFDIRLFLVFCSGLFLFLYADSLSRSTAFYYFAGVTLGILATPVLFLMILKQFISKHSTFGLLMTAGCASSVYFFNYVKENMKWLWHENKSYLLGYFLTTGVISFTACYKHGPLTNQRSINLLTWTLQLIGCLLIYFGVAIYPIAYALIVVLICSKGLCYPARLLCYMGRKIKGCFISDKPIVTFLTEEEYREEAEAETVKALEELRTFCGSPEFPSWIAVSRISSPKKFADFVLGSYHVSPEEMRLHDEQYGPGGLFLEQQLFNTGRKPAQDRRVNTIQEDGDVEQDEENHLDNNANISRDAVLF